MTSEITKTSLLVVATVFTATGASVLADDIVTGSILLFVAIAVLILRGYLKKKGYDLEGAAAKRSDNADQS